MSQPGPGVEPFRVDYSALCRRELRRLLDRSRALGRLEELAQATRDLDTRLRWIPLDFGEPLRDFNELGLREYVGTVAPLVVTYAVDEARRIVYVAVPFRLLSNSGLESP